MLDDTSIALTHSIKRDKIKWAPKYARLQTRKTFLLKLTNNIRPTPTDG